MCAKRNIFLFFLLLSGGFALAGRLMISPIQELTKRVAGKRSILFIYQLLSAHGNKDVFELESAGRKIIISGNNREADEFYRYSI